MSTPGRKSLVRNFGKKLRALRLARNLTLKELAQAMGYRAHSHILGVETGKVQPTVDLVVKVSRFFGVTADVLLDDDRDLT